MVLYKDIQEGRQSHALAAGDDLYMLRSELMNAEQIILDCATEQPRCGMYAVESFLKRKKLNETGSYSAGGKQS